MFPICLTSYHVEGGLSGMDSYVLWYLILLTANELLEWIIPHSTMAVTLEAGRLVTGFLMTGMAKGAGVDRIGSGYVG